MALFIITQEFFVILYIKLFRSKNKIYKLTKYYKNKCRQQHRYSLKFKLTSRSISL